MITKIFKDSSLEKCIEAACSEFNIPERELQYTLLEDKKSLFKRVVTISVNVMEEIEVAAKEQVLEKETESTEGQGTVKVLDGKIIVKNPVDGREPASIAPSKLIRIMIDGLEINTRRPVYDYSVIEFIYDEEVASRTLKISTSPDKSEAYVTIEYIPKGIFGLKDSEESNYLFLETQIIEKRYPPVYNEEEIKEQLKKENIIYGIIKENFALCTRKEGAEKVLIAQGIKSIDDEDDKIEMKANIEAKHLNADEKGNVDFKSIGFVSAVKAGDVLAIIHKGKDGQDGIDIYGKPKKHKKGIKLKVSAGEGCVLKENNIVALVEGKPCLKQNNFCVYKVHEVQGDVDIKSGDIKFIGDVMVSGNVKEGMKIEAGNLIQIQKNIERATITAIGNVIINGSAIYSTITAGGHDVKNLKQMDNMNNLKGQLGTLMETMEQIKKFNLLGNNVNDGEAVKVLIENKFKQLPKACFDIIVSSDAARGSHEEKLVGLLRAKLLGLGPLSIKNYAEVEEIIKLIDENVENLNYSLSLPVNIKVPYCQECTVTSSGDVTFTGNGEYISNITANGNIYFENSQSVARGGELRAKKEIKCKKIGSTGGVSTKLFVEKNGHIWADLAYQNTQFTIGTRKFDFDYPCKDIHSYLNEKGDIIVESLRL